MIIVAFCKYNVEVKIGQLRACDFRDMVIFLKMHAHEFVDEELAACMILSVVGCAHSLSP